MNPLRRTGTYPRGSAEFSRVLSFSDGVMSIAITLLILNINLPIPSDDSAAAAASIPQLMRNLLPQLGAFLVSFVIVAYAWLGHHRLLGSLQRIDGVFIGWNFVYLLLVALVPLQSQLIGLYDSNPEALSLYSLGFALLFLCDLWGLQLAWNRRLMDQRPSRRRRLHGTAAKLLPVLVFLLAIPAVRVVGTGVASWIWLSIWPLELVLDRTLKVRS